MCTCGCVGVSFCALVLVCICMCPDHLCSVLVSGLPAIKILDTRVYDVRFASFVFALCLIVTVCRCCLYADLYCLSMTVWRCCFCADLSPVCTSRGAAASGLPDFVA